MEVSFPTTGDVYSGKVVTLFHPEFHELMEFKFEHTITKGISCTVVQMIVRERKGGRRFVIRFDDVKLKDFPILDQTVEVVAQSRGFGRGANGGVIRVELPFDEHVLFDSASVSVIANA